MARTITIDGSDRTDVIRLGDQSYVEVAYGGEVGVGGFDFDDPAGSSNVPAMKEIVVTESVATPTQMFRGYIGGRDLDRGVLGRVENRRQWHTTILDGNTILDDEVFQISGANRPEETDYARITWLLTTPALSALGITAGVVPNTNTVTMDATDYRHRGPRDVLGDCAESASKNYFIYDYDGTGWKLYYDLATGTSLTSTASLTTVLTEYDGTSVFALENPRLKYDPTRIYSAVDYAYANGYVFVQDTAIATAYRRREIAIGDSEVKTSTGATNRANAYLTRNSTEKKTFLASTSVSAEYVNDIRAGMRIPVKVPHLGISSNTYFRISRRVVSPQKGSPEPSAERYTIDLEFAENLLPARFGTGTPGDTGTITEDGAAVTFARYQMIQESGSPPFGPAAGLYDQATPSFGLSSLAGATDGKVDRAPEANISWPYTDCGVGTGAVAGLASQAVWHRFTVDLSDSTFVGIRFTIAPFLVQGTGYTTSPGGMLIGTDTVSCGIATGTSSSGAGFTDQDEYVEVGRVGDQGGSVFVPRSVLMDVTDGYNWFVLGPAWDIGTTLLICNSAGNKPWGYGITGHDTNASSIVSAVEVHSSGAGLSGWLPADGAVDGSNTTFALPLWNGEGVPEVRVGAIILNTGEYTYDAGALTVTLNVAPPTIMAGQVYYRAQVG